MDLLALVRSRASTYRSIRSLRPPAARDWTHPFDTLRAKWTEVPAGAGRASTKYLLALPDDELLATWNRAFDAENTADNRGWYHEKYSCVLQGKRVLDVGAGFGISSLYFAQRGARVTFLDLHEDNLAVVRRLAKLMQIPVPEFVLMRDLDSLRALGAFDVVFAQGSLHHAPASVVQPEIHELLRHLIIGGRWLQLAYPRRRWERDGKLDFSRWGELTDGRGTPWAEWYDLPKLLSVMKPARMDVEVYKEFHRGDFNWFDLIYRGGL